VLERHPNRDVRAKYEKTIQEWIPTKMLTRFRNTVYNRIVQGKFDLYICNLLSENKPYDPTKIDRTWPYYADDDSINRQLRKNEYLKKSEMLDKLTDEGEGPQMLKPRELSDVFYLDQGQLLAWDLSIDYVAEHVPDEIVKCLRISHLAKQK
jgi:hypothetical protein